MPGSSTHSTPAPAAVAARHALAWLLVASAVGLLLATWLLVPSLSGAFGPLTYGRWAAVHLDLSLYGWLALPWVAVLLRWFRAVANGVGSANGMRRSASDRLGRWAVAAWSAALVAGAVSWLGGETTGKLFLDWSGVARWVLLGACVALWVALVAQLAAGTWPSGGRGGAAVLVLLVLLGVPYALWRASDPHLYPPVDPETGGPTGASLLGSSLGLVVMLLALPSLLGLASRVDAEIHRRRSRLAVALLVAHAAGFVALEALSGGDRSHRDGLQQLALASVLPWGPLLWRWLASHAWPAAARRFTLAAIGWSALLLGSAVVMFRPGVLDVLKFTNALVAHAHLAMAGMLSAVSMLLLATLAAEGADSGDRGWRAVMRGLASPAPFWWWQGGLAVQLVALTLVGIAEASDPGLVIRGDRVSALAYAVRWLGGAAMVTGSWLWWRRVVLWWPRPARGVAVRPAARALAADGAGLQRPTSTAPAWRLAEPAGSAPWREERA